MLVKSSLRPQRYTYTISKYISCTNFHQSISGERPVVLHYRSQISLHRNKYLYVLPFQIQKLLIHTAHFRSNLKRRKRHRRVVLRRGKFIWEAIVEIRETDICRIRITYTRRFVNVTMTGGKRKVCLWVLSMFEFDDMLGGYMLYMPPERGGGAVKDVRWLTNLCDR